MLHAARATAASRQAITELLASGETGITCREIFDGFPSHVEQEGRLVTLRQWHDGSLHDLCFGELFSLCAPERQESSRPLSSGGSACPRRTSKPCEALIDGRRRNRVGAGQA